MCGVLPAERGLILWCPPSKEGLKCVWCPPSREGANIGVLPAERGLICVVPPSREGAKVCVVSSQQRGG